jgi:hypothetical protein
VIEPDAIEASQRLDRVLVETLAALRASVPGQPIFRRVKEVPMSGFGGKEIGGSFREQFRALRAQLDEVKVEAAAAMTEASSELQNARGVIGDIRADTAELRAAFRSTSNEPPAGA